MEMHTRTSKRLATHTECFKKFIEDATRGSRRRNNKIGGRKIPEHVGVGHLQSTEIREEKKEDEDSAVCRADDTRRRDGGDDRLGSIKTQGRQQGGEPSHRLVGGEGIEGGDDKNSRPETQRGVSDICNSQEGRGVLQDYSRPTMAECTHQIQSIQVGYTDQIQNVTSELQGGNGPRPKRRIQAHHYPRRGSRSIRVRARREILCAAMHPIRVECISEDMAADSGGNSCRGGEQRHPYYDVRRRHFGARRRRAKLRGRYEPHGRVAQGVRCSDQQRQVTPYASGRSAISGVHDQSNVRNVCSGEEQDVQHQTGSSERVECEVDDAITNSTPIRDPTRCAVSSSISEHQDSLDISFRVDAVIKRMEGLIDNLESDEMGAGVLGSHQEVAVDSQVPAGNRDGTSDIGCKQYGPWLGAMEGWEADRDDGRGVESSRAAQAQHSEGDSCSAKRIEEFLKQQANTSRFDNQLANGLCSGTSNTNAIQNTLGRVIQNRIVDRKGAGPQQMDSTCRPHQGVRQQPGRLSIAARSAGHATFTGAARGLHVIGAAHEKEAHTGPLRDILEHAVQPICKSILRASSSGVRRNVIQLARGSGMGTPTHRLNRGSNDQTTRKTPSNYGDSAKMDEQVVAQGATPQARVNAGADSGQGSGVVHRRERGTGCKNVGYVCVHASSDVESLMEHELEPNTRKGYAEAWNKVVNMNKEGEQHPIGTYDIQSAIAQEARNASCISGVKQIIAAAKRNLEGNCSVQWKKVEAARRAAYKVIRRRRETAPARDILTELEMRGIVSIAIAVDGKRSARTQAALVFAVQALFALRGASIRTMQATDFHDEDNTFSLVIRSEKVAREQGAPREIRSFPWDVSNLCENSAITWNPVLHTLRGDITAAARAGRQRIKLPRTRDSIATSEYFERWRFGDELPGYETLNKNIREIIMEVAPRFIGKSRYGTHTARRTGASLHFVEGWAPKLIMEVGGWKDEQEFGKYIQGVLGTIQMQRAFTHA